MRRTLAVVAILILAACSSVTAEEPEPTPTLLERLSPEYQESQRQQRILDQPATLSDGEAIAIVQTQLGQMRQGGGNCLALYNPNVGRYWSTYEGLGRWQVNYIGIQRGFQNGNTSGLWDVFESTLTMSKVRSFGPNTGDC